MHHEIIKIFHEAFIAYYQAWSFMENETKHGENYRYIQRTVQENLLSIPRLIDSIMDKSQSPIENSPTFVNFKIAIRILQDSIKMLDEFCKERKLSLIHKENLNIINRLDILRNNLRDMHITEEKTC